MAVRVVVTCLLLVTAGCAMPGVSQQSPSAAGSPTGTAVTSATPTASRTALPASAENPWRSAEVVVAIEASATPNRSFAPLVEEAVTYWNGPGRPNATYPATFRVVPDADDPDVVVSFEDQVVCADHDDVLGCAPQLAATDRPPTPVTIEIATGFSDETTVRTIKHEFGHLLGIEHGEPPLPLMEAAFVAATLPATDATNKSNPWPTTDLRVYVDLSSGAESAETRRFQVRQAVAYYDAGAEGHVPENTSFQLIEDRSAAQIVVVFDTDYAGCSTAEAQSCGFREGYDPDRDGALEYYTNGTIVVNGIDDDAVGWHVGYWLGVLMGHDRPAEFAPPFVNASYEERRSDWWE